MHAFQVATWRAAVIGRWTARIAGTLMLLLFLAFFFGEGPPEFSRLTTAERLQWFGLTTTFLGLAIAWKWEGLGGLIALAGFPAVMAGTGGNLRVWAFCVPAIIAVVHIASWGRLRNGAPTGLGPWRLPRSVVFSLLGLLAVFLALSANEIFGQPPLMTPKLHPDGELTGAWYGIPNRGSAVEFIIHSDGSVTGTVGEAALTEGRIAYGRSWYGRMLHLNAPYIIAGRLSNAGDRFTMPLEIRGDILDGSLFLKNRPQRLMLTRRPADGF
jgi:hypothetical protein